MISADGTWFQLKLYGQHSMFLMEPYPFRCIVQLFFKNDFFHINYYLKIDNL